MNGPAVVSVSRIAPEAALRTWPRLVETLADSGDTVDELVCYISPCSGTVTASRKASGGCAARSRPRRQRASSA